MIKSILKLAVVLFIGIVFYNYFWGTPEEKAEAKETITKVKDAGKVIGGALLDLAKDGIELIKNEREKFAEGKYDKAMDNVGGLLKDMKHKVEGTGGEMVDRVKDLEQDKEALAKKLEDAKNSTEGISGDTKKKLKIEFDELMDKTEKVLQDMEKQGN